MRELIVLFLIILVIYLNRSQCKTQKGGATATTVGIGFVITAIIAGAGYFVYKELTRPSPSKSPSKSDDSDDTGKVGSGSSKKRKKKDGDIVNNYYFTDVGEDVIRCDSLATDPPAFCPDNSQCPASGICPSGNQTTECEKEAEDKCESSRRKNHKSCIECMKNIKNECQYLAGPFCASSQQLGCQETLNSLCSGEKSSVGNCFVCAGQHQSELKSAGCGESDLDQFCKMPAPVPFQNDGNVLFENKTGEDIVILFNMKIPTRWKFYIDGQEAPQFPERSRLASTNPDMWPASPYDPANPPLDKDGKEVIPEPTRVTNWFYIVPRGKTLSGKEVRPQFPSVGPCWGGSQRPQESGMAVAIKLSDLHTDDEGQATYAPFSQNMDVTGLTKMEWTFDIKDNKPAQLSTDVSGVDGVNADIQLRIEGVDMDVTTNKNICNTDPSTTKGCTLLKNKGGKCPTPHPESKWNPDGTNRSNNTPKGGSEPGTKSPIKFCAPPDGTAEVNGVNLNKTISQKGQCGIDNDCVKCQTGVDLCKPFYPAPDTNVCFAQNYARRFGCNQWWDHTENEDAKAWKDWFDSGNCPSYSWAYGEMAIQGGVSGTSFEKFQEYTDQTWTSSDDYKCATGKLSGDPCEGRLVEVSSGLQRETPLVACQKFDFNTKVIFTISYIK